MTLLNIILNTKALQCYEIRMLKQESLFYSDYLLYSDFSLLLIIQNILTTIDTIKHLICLKKNVLPIFRIPTKFHHKIFIITVFTHTYIYTHLNFRFTYVHKLFLNLM